MEQLELPFKIKSLTDPMEIGNWFRKLGFYKRCSEKEMVAAVKALLRNYNGYFCTDNKRYYLKPTNDPLGKFLIIGIDELPRGSYRWALGRDMGE